jgi:hypothetical protein
VVGQAAVADHARWRRRSGGIGVDGLFPDAFATLPKEWTSDQIRQFQDYFDALMSGNLPPDRDAPSPDVRAIYACHKKMCLDF